MNLKILLFALALLLLAPTAYAQTPSSVLVNMAPPNPAPGENVTITLNSYVNNLDTVLIRWLVNGKIVSSGIGKKTFSATAGPAGSQTGVTAIVSLPEGEIEVKVAIKPAALVLLWQAVDSYVPPFYRGKALPTAEGEIKVVAMPEVRAGSGGGLVDAKNMTFAWRKDYTNDQAGSGFGRNFFLYTNDYLEDSNNIRVKASTLDQTYSAEASVDIPASAPKILFYKNDSGLGTIFEQALPDIYQMVESAVVEAVPYFISPKDIRHPALIWRWFINGSPISQNPSSLKKNLMPLRAEKGTHGASKLRLEIENRDRIFQTAEKEMNVEF